MTAFISIYILLGAVCVCLLSEETVFNVSGPVGSTAVLPCHLTSVNTDTPHIKWQIKPMTVFEREGEKTYQAKGYDGRVEVPVEELRKGNCSLVLRNLSLNDTGVYTCYLAVRRTKRAVSITNTLISRVYLTVSDRTKERETSDKTEEPSGNGGRNLQYLWLLILPGLVLPGLVV